MNLMKNIYFAASLILVSSNSLRVQAVDDLNQGLTISYDNSLDEVTVSWWTRPAYFYFLLTTEDLANDPWTYFDFAVMGDSSAKGIIMSLSGDKMFFHVELTNDVNSPLLALDQDGDKVSTVDELVQGTDPFLSLSLDADAIPDDWEVLHNLDTTPGVDSSGDDSEPDGASLTTEFANDLDPNVRDHPALELFLH